MQIKTEQWKNWIQISLGSQFVVRNLTSVRPVLESAESRDIPLVALDLEGCTHLDSSAISLIVNHYKKLLAKGGKLVIFGANTDIKEILSIVGLDRLVPVFSTKEEFKKANDNVES